MSTQGVNLGNFDARQVEPNRAPGALPTAWYNVAISESSTVATKAQDGAFLELKLKVLDGPFAGRVVTDRLNLWNKNQVAVEIAFRTLSSICHATGVLQVQSTLQLHGVPMQARVVYKPAEGSYDEGNDVKGYRSIAEGQAAAAASAPPLAFGGSPAPVGPGPFSPPAPSAPPSFAPPQQSAPEGGVVPPWQQPAAPAPAAPQQFAPPPQQQFAPPAAPAMPTFAPPAAPTFAPPAPPAAAPAGGAPLTPPWQR